MLDSFYGELHDTFGNRHPYDARSDRAWSDLDIEQVFADSRISHHHLRQDLARTQMEQQQSTQIGQYYQQLDALQGTVFRTAGLGDLNAGIKAAEQRGWQDAFGGFKSI